MRERIVNFANKENQLINWSPWVRCRASSDFEKELEILLGQLNLLLEKYPDALEKDTVLKKTKALLEYAKKRGFTLSNCYSYSNTERIPIKRILDIGKYSYGVRTLIDTSGFGPITITITEYTSTLSNYIVDKDQLNLELYDGELQYLNMIHRESSGTFICDGEALSSLKPNILTKHL